jgi:hypothetical protein
MGALSSRYRRYQGAKLVGKRVVSRRQNVSYLKPGSWVYREDLLKKGVLLREMGGAYNFMLHVGRIYAWVDRRGIIIRTEINNVSCK